MVNKGGRPTKLTDELIEKARHYVRNFDKEPYNDVIPSLVSLAYVCGLATSTVNDWKARAVDERFSDICSQIEQLQHKRLIDNGLTGVFTPAITKMILSKHGYSDRIDHASTDGSMSQPSRIEIVAPQHDSQKD